MWVLQLAALILGGAGTVGTLAATAMPQWRVSAFVDGNIVVFETLWEGLWMGCVSQLGLRLQCQFYGSALALPAPLEALRALMCAASALAPLAFLAAAAGAPHSGHGPRALGALAPAAGLAFLLAAALVLVPVSWAGAAIVRDFRDPAVPAALKRELGPALFVGWASGAMLLIAGSLYCGGWARAARTAHPRRTHTGTGIRVYV